MPIQDATQNDVAIEQKQNDVKNDEQEMDENVGAGH